MLGRILFVYRAPEATTHRTFAFLVVDHWTVTGTVDPFHKEFTLLR